MRCYTHCVAAFSGCVYIHYCNCVAISCYHSPLTIWALGPV